MKKRQRKRGEIKRRKKRKMTDNSAKIENSGKDR